MFTELIPREIAAPFVSVEEALEEIRRGRMVILMDDEQRENEGDLCMAAEKATPEAINFMIKFGRGLICLPMAPELTERLGLTMMVGDNRTPMGTAFTVSINARRLAGTGVSAADRAATILEAVRDDGVGAALVSPGHVFPLRARAGGVLVRTGQTEGAVDLARMAGLRPAGVICEVLKDDGTMARLNDLVAFARHYRLKMLTVADIIEYRLRNETMVQRVAEARLPTEYGDFQALVYRDLVDLTEHLVLTMGDLSKPEPVMVRAHREYLPGDIFGYRERDTRQLLAAAMRQIAAGGRGVILYLKRNFNAIAAEMGGALAEKPRASTHPNAMGGEFREYGIGAQILRDVGVRKMIILSDQAPRLANLPGYGLEIVDSVPLSLAPEAHPQPNGKPKP